jgi:Mrp family chromosome partitioning ATPase
MSRMLEALKRLEAHSWSPSAVGPRAAEPSHRAEAPAPAPDVLPAVPIVTPQEIEARLDQAEQLAREAEATVSSAVRCEPAPSLIAIERPATIQPRIEAVHRAAPRPVIAPHYAHLRERILTQIPRDRSAALLFVHPGDVEELATAVAELAVAMTDAMSGDILAIDANVAQASAPEAASGGLVDVLAGRTEWYTAVSPTRNPRVVLLPAGASPTAAALPSEARVQAIVNQFKSRFDIVLIDGGAVDNRFATLLAKSCDACYVMLKLAQTRQRAVTAAIERLRQAGGRVSGCILGGATAAEAENARS